MYEVEQHIRIGLAQRLMSQGAKSDLALANLAGDNTSQAPRTEHPDGEEHLVLRLNAVDRGVTHTGDALGQQAQQPLAQVRVLFFFEPVAEDLLLRKLSAHVRATPPGAACHAGRLRGRDSRSRHTTTCVSETSRNGSPPRNISSGRNEHSQARHILTWAGKGSCSGLTQPVSSNEGNIVCVIKRLRNQRSGQLRFLG